jgi:hypothetical protein
MKQSSLRLTRANKFASVEALYQVLERTELRISDRWRQSHLEAKCSENT